MTGDLYKAAVEKAARAIQLPYTKNGSMVTVLSAHIAEMSAKAALDAIGFREIVKALEQIAAYNDEGANKRLANTGSFSAFDEPGAVETARSILDKLRNAK